MTEKHYNLIDEQWIPVAVFGLASLRQIFSQDDLRSLGGTPLQKIAVMKLLLAIAQAAKTPEDNAEWNQLGSQGMRSAILAYLEKWHDAFWLYGEKPFLQMPAVKNARLIEYGSIMPEIATGNATLLTQWQNPYSPTDAQKALLLVVNMSCCFSGKKVDKTIALSKGLEKSASAKAGPALCYAGLLHSFITGKNIMETVWLNVLTQEAIQKNKNYTEGIGTPPWEKMPEGEVCETAKKLIASLMGRLVPMARFCFLEEKGIHNVEGIQHPDYQQGFVDPSASADNSGSKTRMLWADPEKRPWRSLTAMLSFLHKNASSKFDCVYLREGIPRLSVTNFGQFGIWSGGVRLSSNAGEQYLTGSDDVVESEFSLNTEETNSGDNNWFLNLENSMTQTEEIAKRLYGSVLNYFKDEKAGNAEDYAKSATNLFWQMTERHFTDLLNACALETYEKGSIQKILRQIVGEAFAVYNTICPQETARQLQSWADHKPRLGKFLTEK